LDRLAAAGIRSGHPEAEREDDLGEAAHPRTADTHEVDLLVPLEDTRPRHGPQTSARCETLRSRPTAAIATSSEDPPEETNGSGSPFVGNSPTTTPRLTTAWFTSSAETPNARSAPNGSATRSPIRIPR